MAYDSQNVHLSSNSLHIGHLTYLRLHYDLNSHRFTCGQMNSCFDYPEGTGTYSPPQKVVAYLLTTLLLLFGDLTVHYSYNYCEA